MVRCFLRGAKKSLETMFYAVRSGRNAGVYRTWDECKSQVDGYSGARFKKFKSRDEALNFMGIQIVYTYCKTHWKQGESKVAKVHKRHSKPHYGGSQASYGGSQTNGRSQEYYGGSGSYYNQGGSTQYYGGASNSSDEESSFQPSSSIYRQGSNQSGSSSYGQSVPSSSSCRQSSNVPSSSKKNENVPVVYTDGGCSANGRRKASAGIGVFWGDGDRRNVSEKLQGLQTNQRAELNAAIRAVEGAVDSNMREVEIRTDSMYTINCATNWIKGWKKNGWKAATGDKVKNQEDIQKLYELGQQVKVNWVHVKAHAGIHGNEQADKLSKAGAKKSSK